MSDDFVENRREHSAPAVAAQASEAQPFSVIKPVARGRDGQGMAQMAKEDG